ncbi:DUF3822 family protein [Robiginitalea sp.]|nr:DUF3822 family protein [Robiginitalea sp.]
MIKKVNNNNIQGTPKEDWYHKLSIQVSLNGLSFCVLNTHEQVLEVCFSERFSKQLTPFQLQQQLKERFREKSIRKFQFSEVLTIHDNLLFSLVPQALFDSDHLANYLKYNARMLPTDHLEYDTLSGLEIQNVYVPYTNVNNFIFEQFGEFEFKHTNTVLLETLIKLHGISSETIGYIHLTTNQMDIAIFGHRNLLYFNSFAITSDTDFLYYLLFSLEQLGENPEQFKLRLVGEITDQDSRFQLASAYFENISILLPPPAPFSNSDLERSIDFTLIHTL